MAEYGAGGPTATANDQRHEIPCPGPDALPEVEEGCCYEGDDEDDRRGEAGVVTVEYEGIGIVEVRVVVGRHFRWESEWLVNGLVACRTVPISKLAGYLSIYSKPLANYYI